MFHRIQNELVNFTLVERIQRWFDQPSQKRGITIHFASGKEIEVMERYQQKAFQQLEALMENPQSLDHAIAYPPTWPPARFAFGQAVYGPEDAHPRRIMGIFRREDLPDTDAQSGWYYRVGKKWIAEESIRLELAGTSPQAIAPPAPHK